MKGKINHKLGDHWAILGATGTGKTHFSLHLLRTLAVATKGLLPIYVLDTKAPIARPAKSDFTEFFRKGIGKRFTGNKLPPINPKKSHGIFTVWTPEEDIPELYDEFFHGIYKAARPAIVMIDELSSITNRMGHAPRHYDILMKQGRGLDISMLNCTQAPVYLPPSTIRQAMHVVRFRLNDIKDSKKLTPSMGRVIESEPKHDHGFYYRNVSVPVAKMPATYYENMQEFFGIK